MERPFVGLYLKSSDWLLDQGVSETVSLYNRAADRGYPDLILWDNFAQRPQPTSEYPGATELQKAVTARGGRIIVQTAYFGQMLADYIGDGSVLENGSDQQGDRFACLADPRVMAAWEEQAKRVRFWWPTAAGVMLSYDEYRIQGTHTTCRAYAGHYGSLLAAHAMAAIAMHRRVNPDWLIALWSDMFDPYENAGPGDYYRVKGGWGGSWQGLDPGCLIVNWNTKGDETCEPGFRHFAGLGNTQIFAGYYDGPDGDGISAPSEKQVLANALEWSGGELAGYVYTSWENNYDHLSEYYPGRDLIARMKPFPAATPEPTPVPQPPPVPAPPPNPLAAVRAALDELDEPLSAFYHHTERVKGKTLRAALRADQAALASGVAKAKAATKG